MRTDASTLSLVSGSPPTNFAIDGHNITFTPPLGSAGPGASQTYSFDLSVSDGNPMSSSSNLSNSRFWRETSLLILSERQSVCDGPERHHTRRLQQIDFAFLVFFSSLSELR